MTNPNAACRRSSTSWLQLFDLVLPSLESVPSRTGPAQRAWISKTSAIDFTQYLASVSLYGVLYTTIVLLFGLILFEDRDLA